MTSICRSYGDRIFHSCRCYNDAAPTARRPTTAAFFVLTVQTFPGLSNFRSPPAQPRGFLLDQKREGRHHSVLLTWLRQRAAAGFAESSVIYTAAGLRGLRCFGSLGALGAGAAAGCGWAAAGTVEVAGLG